MSASHSRSPGCRGGSSEREPGACCAGSGWATVSITDNAIDETEDDGIGVNLYEGGNVDVTVARNTLEDIGGDLFRLLDHGLGRFPDRGAADLQRA